MRTSLTLFLFVLLSIPSHALAEVLWAEKILETQLSIHESPRNTFHFVVGSQTDTSKTEAVQKRKVSLNGGAKQIRISIENESGRVANPKRLPIPVNPLLKSVLVKEHTIEVFLSEEGWQKKRLQETSTQTRISATLPQQQFEMSAFASKGANVPVMKVWDAKVKSRKVVPVPIMRLSDEELGELEKVEKEDFEVVTEEKTEESVGSDVEAENTLEDAVAREIRGETEELSPVEEEALGNANPLELVASQMITGGAVEVPEQAIEKPTVIDDFEIADKSETPQVVKAQLAVQEKDLLPKVETAEKEEIFSVRSHSLRFIPQEMSGIVGDTIQFSITNDGMETTSFQFKVFEEKNPGKDRSISPTSALRLTPASVELLPKQSETISVAFTRPQLERERIFQVKSVMKDSTQTVDEKVRLFLQPRDGIARVAWNREADGVIFMNGGNISSKFVDIQSCNGSCRKLPDLYLYPGVEAQLKVPAEAELRLTQMVGENKQSGVIPGLDKK